MVQTASVTIVNQMLAQAVGLHRQGQLDEAEKLYSRVLKIERGQFDALHLLGLLNHQRGKAGEAMRLFRAALKVHPNSADALANFAMVLHGLKRDDEAMQSLDKALAVAPNHLDALNTRGILLSDLKRPVEAVTAFDRVLALEPRHTIARVNRGNALVDLGEGQRALADYDTALLAEPGNPYVLYNRGNALRTLGREADALASYDQALAGAPGHVGAWHNRGLALQGLNRHHEATASYARALALQSDHADAQFNEASAWLTVGDYRLGLPKYEWRWKRAGMVPRKDLRKPLWLGETPIAGKTILLHAEQGLGDTIMFARYAPVLARLGAKVVIEAQPELKTLLSGLDGVAAVVARGERLPAFDVHCPLASLPLACKTDISTIPADIPYLRASAERIAKWQPRLDALPHPRIALSWSGRAAHPNDRNRSLALSGFAPLLAAAPGAGFVSIQRELRAADAETLRRETRIVPLGDELTDFADTAAVLMLCDLVICVDTSVAHVAAALGRPVFVLLPFQPDWRWLLDRDHSPWYPAATLFRQIAPGDWNSVIERLSEKLASGRWAVT